jgi:hypothetical protein
MIEERAPHHHGLARRTEQRGVDIGEVQEERPVPPALWKNMS